MLYLIHGPDTFRAKQFIEKITAQITKDKNINLTKIDGSTISENNLQSALETNQLFTLGQLIVIKNLFSTKKQKKAQEILSNYIKNFAENDHLIIWENQNFDKRTSLYKFIQKKYSAKNILEFNQLKNHELVLWLKQYCQENNIKIEPQAITKLVAKNQNTNTIYNELNKLAIFSDNNITNSLIDQYASKNNLDIIFSLTDQFGQKQNSLAYQTAMNLSRQGEPPEKILATLSTHLINLIIIRKKLDNKESPSNINQQLGLNPFVFNKLITQSKNYTLTELINTFKNICQADINLKTGQSNFETEILTILQPIDK